MVAGSHFFLYQPFLLRVSGGVFSIPAFLTKSISKKNMKTFISRSLFWGCLAAGLIAVTSSSFAQTTNKIAAEKKVASSANASTKTEHKQTRGPFRGHLAAVDKTGKTITVGKRTFHITSETKLLRAGKPATLDNAVLGEETSGGFKTAENGKLVATKVNLGPKVDTDKSEANGVQKKK